MAPIAPVAYRVPNQQMEQPIVSSGNRASDIGLIPMAGSQDSGLVEEFFREVGQHRLALTDKIQVRMQADIFGVNDAQTIQIEIARQALQRRIVMPAR